ncbi:unnamed protein product [Dibothriocephalus latus]|uniref:Ubiquitin-like domain-containing protein n=1 Tax=Dibothriocephalus latus TaxID=60516 RepID=A0A3P7NRF6_DIBLA|nr:unnamed protein product [Dibothriocephalus latus]
MKLRLKFRSSFVLVNIENQYSELLHVLELAAVNFKLNAANVELSLNANDYFGFDNSTMRLDELGIVNGDIIYVRSRESLDDIKNTLDSELHSDLNEVRATAENPLDVVRLTYIYPLAPSMPVVFTMYSVAGISNTSIANQLAINKKSNFVDCGLLDSGKPVAYAIYFFCLKVIAPIAEGNPPTLIS